MPFSLEVGAALLPLSSLLSLGKVGARGCAPLFQVVSTSPLSVALNSPSSVAAVFNIYYYVNIIGIRI